MGGREEKIRKQEEWVRERAHGEREYWGREREIEREGGRIHTFNSYFVMSVKAKKRIGQIFVKDKVFINKLGRRD